MVVICIILVVPRRTNREKKIDNFRFEIVSEISRYYALYSHTNEYIYEEGERSSGYINVAEERERERLEIRTIK